MIYGANIKVGGFQLEGNLNKTEDPNIIHVVARYTINDIIDPNFKYGLMEIGAYLFCKMSRPRMCGKNYVLEITGMIEYDVRWRDPND